MPSSNPANHSDPTLSKLLDIDSDLEAQAAQIEAQLSVVQEKRKSLQSVINIFSSSSSATLTPDIAAIATDISPEINSAPVKTPSAESQSSNGAASGKSSAKQPRKTRSATKSKTPPARSGKTSSRGNDLQDYMQSAYKDASLPQAVLQVLEQEPDEVWRIPEIIDSIFVDEIPKNMRSKASTRIATVLSNGLKENKWYRGKTGHYSLSQAAARADSSS
jgi:hypothetical protein